MSITTRQNATRPSMGLAIVGLLVAVGISVAIGAALVTPNLSTPAPEGEPGRGLAALVVPRYAEVRILMPWICETDRKLAPFAIATASCWLVALLVFPVVLGFRRAAANAAEGVNELESAKAAARDIKRVWVMWTALSLVVMAATAAWNLYRIRAGIGPQYGDWQRKLTYEQDLAMCLPAFIGIPLAGLLIACVTSACSVGSRSPWVACIGSYIASAVAAAFVAMLALNIPASIDTFVEGPGMRYQNLPALIVGWSSYAGFAGLASALAWYVTAQSAAKTAAKSAN
jgi:hypothetical protein